MSDGDRTLVSYGVNPRSCVIYLCLPVSYCPAHLPLWPVSGTRAGGLTHTNESVADFVQPARSSDWSSGVLTRIRKDLSVVMSQISQEKDKAGFIVFFT